ncbi:MAG: alginate lyase family protein, partial [Anaerolineales bacterium]|nr:alginate lyase family protein [Anaerolineales bacterium]
MRNSSRFAFLILTAIILFIFVACAPSAATPSTTKNAPSESEGLLICNFEKDISIWQGYSQSTETQIKPGETPPAGYINVAKYHAKYTDRWVKPMAGFVASKEQLKEGQASGKWENTVENDRLVAIEIPHDWSAYKYLTFWAYSVTANKAAIELVAYSEPERAAEDNYYKLEVVIDWSGWRKFEIPLKEFAANRNPVGWHKIDFIKIASSGWSHNPSPTTMLYFDAMKLSNARTESEVKIELSNKHPNLLLNAAEIAEIKQKIAKYDWAKTAFQNVSANAFMWSTRTIKLPETGGGYYHAGGADYAITQQHYDLSNAARDLALVWQLTGERKYADKSKEILLAYAGKYLSYAIHDKEGRVGDKASAGGRTTPQGINEAAWVIPIAWAYDLLYDLLSPAERDQIAKNILRPAAELLMVNNEGRHNHQSWYNAGIGVIGFALGEKEYVEHALYKKGSGFFYQMKSSVTSDGLWYEGAMHYQFYVLQALGPLAQAAHHAGIDVYQEPGYKALFDFPLAYADATMRLPVINDGREVYLGASDRNRYYEAAYRQMRDARYANVLRASDRVSLEALIYGVPELPPAQSLPWRSADFAKSGLAVLRAGKDFGAKQVVLNYMGYEGGHSHPDQLGIVISGLGRVLAPDAGSIKYEDPAHNGWYKQSLSHNLVVVSEKSQQRAPMGKLETFASGAQLQVARASTTKSYGSVNLARTILLNDDYLVDIFQTDSVVEETFDWTYHNFGRFATDLKLTPMTLNKKNGYEFLSNLTGIKTDDAWRADWTIASDQKVRLFMAGAPGTQVIAAEGLVAALVGDETSPEKVPLVIARRKAKSASFVSIIEPYSTAPAISAITPLAAMDAIGFRIARAKANDVLLFSNTRGTKRIGEYTLDGGIAWLSQSDGALQSLYLGAG